jgi:outer membrane lipoprotein-sorting protein
MKRVVCGIGVWFVCLVAVAQSGGEILEKMDGVLMAPGDRQGNVEIILIDKNGKEKVREAYMMQKGPYKKLYRYTKPESQAGIATLSLPDDVMWLYMPAFGKPRRINILAKSGAFNGTDFSYEDMANMPYANYYEAAFEAKEDNTVKIVMTPKGKSQYSKIEAWVNASDFYPERFTYYDRNGSKLKEAVYEYEKVDGFWNASLISMTDIRKNHKTLIRLKDVKFNQDLDDSLFTVEAMQLPD